MATARACIHTLSGKVLPLLFLAAGSALAGDPPAPSPGDLTEASLETLMNIQVSSPGRKDQKLNQTAGAVYVITQEDIHRSGATSIPDVLRMVPGLQVAQINGNAWVVTARGFASRFANKMLVMIDGRSIYNNIYSGVYWDQNLVPLDQIERIEVIRGPGATMWGANAVNGVINIITKPAQETQGLTATARSGAQSHAFGSVRFGGNLGDQAAYRVYSQYFNQSPLDRATQPYDGWSHMQGGGRLDWKPASRDSFSISGDVYSGTAQQRIFPNYPANALVPAIPDTVGTSGGYAMARWTRRFSDTSDIALQFSFNGEYRSEAFGRLNSHTVDLDFQHHIALSARQDLMWGLGFRIYHDRVESLPIPGREADFIQFIPPSATQPLASAFVEDTIALRPDRWTLTLGTQIEHNVYTGFEIQPTVRLAWTPTSQQTFWSAVSRAVRTPVRVDRNLLLEFQPLPVEGVEGELRGDSQFQSEKTVAYEAGYRNQPASWVTLDLAAFYSGYRDLRGMEVGAPTLRLGPPPELVIPIAFRNTGAGHTYGIELATNWSVTQKWRLGANYSWFRYGQDPRRQGPPGIPMDLEHASPAHQAQFRSQLDISRKLQFDAGVYFVSALTAMGVPAYARTDVRLGWHVTPAVEISLAGQNLLDGRHVEFVPEDYVVGSRPGRTAYVKVTWAF